MYSTDTGNLLYSDAHNSIIGRPKIWSTTSYTPFGRKPRPTEALLGFNGALLEQRLECYLLGNGYRAYMPKLMRFNGPDSLSPFGRGGLNAYAYCSGDPVNRTDPSGHMSKGSWHLPIKRSLKALEKRSRRKAAALERMRSIDPFSRPFHRPDIFHYSYTLGEFSGIPSGEREAKASIAEEIDSMTRVLERTPSLLAKSMGASLRADPKGVLPRPKLTTRMAPVWGPFFDSIQELKRINGSPLAFLIDTAEVPGPNRLFAKKTVGNIFSATTRLDGIASYEAYNKVHLMRTRDLAQVGHYMRRLSM
jgi:RHS repeat-associated protein